MRRNQKTLARIAAIVGIIGGVLGIVAALTDSNPTFSWIALCVVIIALAWYFAEGLRTALVIILLALIGVAAIGVALWLGPVTVEITVYVDQNGDGMRDGGEPTVGPGIVLELLDSNHITRTAVTDERGMAIFPNVPQGPYGLKIGAPGISGRAMRFNTEYVVAISPTPLPLTATVMPAPIPTEPQTATSPEMVVPGDTPPCSDDLVNCSVQLVRVGNITSSMASGKLEINFQNHQNGSALVLQFAPPLNVRGFPYLELSGRSVGTCAFQIEYKVNSGSQLNKVKISDTLSFDGPADATQRFRIPIVYQGEIDEIAINFYVIDEACTVIIESMRLSQ